MWEDISVAQMANRIINDLNEGGNMGAYLAFLTDHGNCVIRFNNPRIPSILVAISHLNEPYLYKYNICKKQKSITKIMLNKEWVYYYRFYDAILLIREMMIYKPIANLKIK